MGSYSLSGEIGGGQDGVRNTNQVIADSEEFYTELIKT